MIFFFLFGVERLFEGALKMDPDLIGNLDINSVVKELRKESLSIKNRLQSIIHDYYFVESALTSDFPIIPNERCGLWYVPPRKRHETSYFKSTDGHTNEWRFSMRRLNLNLLPILAEFKGIQIVDSTRKGKLMPDALSKTIPIWCAVINSLLYDGDSDDVILSELDIRKDSDEGHFIIHLRNNCKWLWTPSNIISENEQIAIISKIDSFVAEVKRLGIITKERLISDLQIRRPILPEWRFPGKHGSMTTFEKLYGGDKISIYRVLCIVASKRQSDGEGSRVTVRRASDTSLKSISWYYVQGSADDHELWATREICNNNFSPEFFWNDIMDNTEHRYKLIDPTTGYIKDELADSEVIRIINQIYDEVNKLDKTNANLEIDMTLIKNEENDSNIAFGRIDCDISIDNFHQVYPTYKQLVIFSDKFTVTPSSTTPSPVTVFHYKFDNSKKGSKALRFIFPELVPKLDLGQRMLILCESGKDLSSGLAILLLAKFFNLDWTRSNDLHVNKDTIKKHMSALADVRKINPSRNTLQSVNSYIF